MNTMYRILLLCVVSSTVYAQTVLKHNELSFSNGTGFSDSISEELPIDSIPSNVTYEDYLSYVYGFSVYDLGTVNVLGGSSSNLIFGNWLGGAVSTVNYYSGIEGISSAGSQGSAGAPNNAYSDIQVSTALNEDSVWLRSDTHNKNQIDAYASIDVAFNPVSQLPLALQAEGGHVNINDNLVVFSSPLSEGKVGIGTTRPEEHLHVVGNVNVRSLYGNVGAIIPLPFYANKTILGLDKSKAIICYRAEFSTSDWTTDMEALIFLSWVTSVHNNYSPGTGSVQQRKNEIIHTIFLFEGNTASITDSSIPIEISSPLAFDFHTLAVNKDFTGFLGHQLEKNKTYTVILTALLDNSADGAGATGSYINLFSISGSVFAEPF